MSNPYHPPKEVGARSAGRAFWDKSLLHSPRWWTGMILVGMVLIGLGLVIGSTTFTAPRPAVANLSEVVSLLGGTSLVIVSVLKRQRSIHQKSRHSKSARLEKEKAGQAIGN